MGLLIPWKWNPDSTYTSSFVLETSLTDFDEPYIPKNIYGMELNTITIGDISASFDVYWRKNPQDSYTFWGSHNNTNNHLPAALIFYSIEKGQTGKINIYNDAKPIENVMVFQIKIEATGWGEFAINDLNILFRPKRKWTATDVKTYIRAT